MNKFPHLISKSVEVKICGGKNCVEVNKNRLHLCPTARSPVGQPARPRAGPLVDSSAHLPLQLSAHSLIRPAAAPLGRTRVRAPGDSSAKLLVHHYSILAVASSVIDPTFTCAPHRPSVLQRAGTKLSSAGSVAAPPPPLKGLAVCTFVCSLVRLSVHWRARPDRCHLRLRVESSIRLPS